MQARTSNLVCIGGAVTHSGVVQAHENVPTVEQLRWLHNSRRESFAARCSAQLHLAITPGGTPCDNTVHWRLASPLSCWQC